jgi:hypothetical protein
MKTYTITDAKKQLGALLRSAAEGEEIGIVSGADIIALRKVEIRAADSRPAPVPYPVEEEQDWGFSPRLREEDSALQTGDDWFFRFEGFESEPGGDAARNHDHYLYGTPRE